jgi:hypothetical protein
MMNQHGKRTTAILPTHSSLNPQKPDANEFHVCWKSDQSGTYLLLRSDKDWNGKVRYIILSGSGCPEIYPVEDFRFIAHHDQTFADLGGWTVVKKVSHAEVGRLRVAMAKPSAPLYVYK